MKKNLTITAKNSSHERIGGWLLFFLFGLFIFGVINFFKGISDIEFLLHTPELTREWRYVLICLDTLYFGGLIAFPLYVIYAFAELKENAVSLAKMFIVLIFSNNLITLIFSVINNEATLDTTSYRSSFHMFINSIIYSIIWFLYLSISKRVNNRLPKESRVTKKFDVLILVSIIVLQILTYYIPEQLLKQSGILQ